MATMKQNTSSLDELLRKIDALPEKGGDAVLVSLDITPSESTQKITPEAGTDGYNEVNVSAIQTETKTANANGDVVPSAGKYLSKVTVSVPAPATQEKSATPSESAQDIVPDSGKYLSKVSVGAIASDYVGSGVARKASADLTASGATITAPAGYYSSAASKSVASGTAGTPSATKGSVSNHSISITPKVTNTTGYITGGEKTGTPVTVSASELVSGNMEITENGNNIDVTDYKTVSVNVPSSGGMNVQGYQGYAQVTSTSYTATAVSLTVKTTGTYNVSWTGWRNTNSGTSGSQLYIGNTAYGTAQTTFVNTYGHSVKLTGVALTEGQTITVRARARSTSYTMSVGNLIIEQTA